MRVSLLSVKGQTPLHTYLLVCLCTYAVSNPPCPALFFLSSVQIKRVVLFICRPDTAQSSVDFAFVQEPITPLAIAHHHEPRCNPSSQHPRPNRVPSSPTATKPTTPPSYPQSPHFRPAASPWPENTTVPAWACLRAVCGPEEYHRLAGSAEVCHEYARKRRSCYGTDQEGVFIEPGGGEGMVVG